MSTWPSTLPLPQAEGFSESGQEGTVRTEMDSGPAEVRTRFTATSRFITYQYDLTRAEKLILDAFYVTVGGSERFYWPDPDTGSTLTARFRSRPTYSGIIAGLYYTATVSFEVLP